MRHYMNVRVVMEGCENSDEAENDFIDFIMVGSEIISSKIDSFEIVDTTTDEDEFYAW